MNIFRLLRIRRKESPALDLSGDSMVTEEADVGPEYSQSVSVGPSEPRTEPRVEHEVVKSPFFMICPSRHRTNFLTGFSRVRRCGVCGFVFQDKS